MRLLRVADFTPEEFYGDAAPPYAIISHTWEEQEISLTELVNGVFTERAGFKKLSFCSNEAARDGLEYFWIDTCCIDKASSAELNEAVNSMFSWYRNAKTCYVYLSDVTAYAEAPDDASMNDWVSVGSTSSHTDLVDQPQGDEWKVHFRRSRWFTRGWTLQELIAPESVVFFSREWQRLGDKSSLEREIHEITGIDESALRGRPLSSYSVEERMSWAENRKTTREEDAAYSLLGMFGVYMPLIYGEGKDRALRRLRKEIAETHTTSDNELAITNTTTLKPNGGRRFAHPSQIQLEQETLIHEGNRSPTAQGRLYSGESLAKSEFRILTLESGVIGDRLVGQLQEADLENPPTYYALSYVWGQEPDLHPILMNGNQILIRSNLFHALQRIRLRSSPIEVWIDSICINQDDDSERNSQVKQMASIYQKAAGVLIWIGEEDSTSKLAMNHVDSIIRPTFQWSGPWWEQYGFTALAQILERPWFRRRWVIQEAALSNNSTIYCGDRQVYMNNFAMAVNLVRSRLNAATGSAAHTGQTPSLEFLANFRDSPAVRLLDTIEGAFRRTEDGSILYRRLSLETLVDLARFSETTDHRDTIYALLSLASDSAMLPEPSQIGTIDPDYSKTVLDVYVDFLLHCVRHSGSLDIICRPWAPSPSSSRHGIPLLKLKDSNGIKLPSWIATRDRLPFGDPSLRLTQRIHANPLAGSSQKRPYNCHYGLAPHVRVGRSTDTGECDGAIYVKGVVLGEIAIRSTRMANAIITKECLQILGTITVNPYSKLANNPDAMWRVLCADRDDKGDPAPPFYRSAMSHLLHLSSEATGASDSVNALDNLSSIDVEELLEAELPDHVKKFLEIVRDTIWNRRTFRAHPFLGVEASTRPLVGLIPQSARVGDHVCIIYGCSVPVVLRKISKSSGDYYWQLIGDAYVDEIMDGEVVQFLPVARRQRAEVEFEIR